MADYEYYVEDADRYVMSLVRRALEAGMEPDVIRSAIRDTARARRPSKRYFEAIIDRYIAEGILDMTELIRDKDRHELRINSAKRRRHAKWYDDDSVLERFERLQDDPYCDPDEANPDRFIPIQTDEYIRQRTNELLK